MHKSILLMIAIIFTLPQAFATKARLQALGQNPNGSYFINDGRNTFLNPANINKLKSHVNLELGGTSVTSTPKAEGGMIYKNNDSHLGFHMGRVGDSAQAIQQADIDVSGATFFNPQNSIEGIYGWSRDMDFGVSLHYANSKSDVGATANLPDSDASIMTVKGGVIADKFSGFASLGLMAESETDAVGGSLTKYDSKLDLILGGTYSIADDKTFSAQFTVLNYDFNNGGGVTGDREGRDISFDFFHRLSEKSGDILIFYTTGLTQTDATIDFDAVGTAKTEATTMFIPISIGVERDVNDWLTLRGSVRQNTIIDTVDFKDGTSNFKTSNIDDTVVAAGLSLKYQGVTIDGTLADSVGGNLNGDNFMANVGMKYGF